MTVEFLVFFDSLSGQKTVRFLLSKKQPYDMMTEKEGASMGYGNTEVFLTWQERENLIQAFLGRTVSVVIDRPIGFHHVTKGIHLDYTVNYGYLPGVTGGDGEEQDVYILGVSQPLETFTGRTIGVVRRKDDNEDKLIAAPEGTAFSAEEMARQLSFVEKYFDSSVFSIFDGV